MDLPVFFQTAATLSPILLAGTAYAFTHRAPPQTRVGSAVLGLIVLGPPTFVILESLSVLAGFASADTWRGPVLVLLYVQLLTGVVGIGGYVLANKADTPSKPLLRKPRERRHPAATDAAADDEMTDSTSMTSAPSPDAPGPDETPEPGDKV